MIEGNFCIAGTSDLAFDPIKKQLLKTSSNHVWEADKLIQNTLGSISFISGQKVQNFSIELKDDEIEVRNNSNQEIFNAITSKLQKERNF